MQVRAVNDTVDGSQMNRSNIGPTAKTEVLKPPSHAEAVAARARTARLR